MSKKFAFLFCAMVIFSLHSFAAQADTNLLVCSLESGEEIRIDTANYGTASVTYADGTSYVNPTQLEYSLDDPSVNHYFMLGGWVDQGAPCSLQLEFDLEQAREFVIEKTTPLRINTSSSDLSCPGRHDKVVSCHIGNDIDSLRSLSNFTDKVIED